ncbi:hypothetical protein ACWD4B_30470, partial [Streptomyces sp. NPDC002536]
MTDAEGGGGRVDCRGPGRAGHGGAGGVHTGRAGNDVQQVQMLTLMGFTLMVSAPIMCIGGIGLA